MLKRLIYRYKVRMVVKHNSLLKPLSVIPILLINLISNVDSVVTLK